jgi:zona occludens toxin (predicted ATPase)
MIIGFVGTPGSGKTYEAVKKLLDNLRLGRRIYTNIDGIESPECLEMIKAYCGLSDFDLAERLHLLDKLQSQDFWRHVQDGSLIILDEVHKLFSNRDWASQTNKEFTEWASTHRHNGFDVVLITQDIEKIDKHARSLIEWTYFFRKVNFFGAAVQKKYLCYAYSGDDHNGQPQAKNIRTYDSKIFRCYKSYVSGDIKELGFMQHVNLLKHPIFYALPIVLSVTLYLLFFQSSFASGDIFGSKSATDKALSRIQQNQPQKKEAVAPVPAPEEKPEKKEVAPAEDTPVESADPVRHVRKYRLRDGSLMFSNSDPPAGASIVMD